MNVIDMSGRTPAQKQGLVSQLVVPRPIAMITTLDASGRLNVAPFSYYMPISGEPPMVAVTVGASREATEAPKDTWVNLGLSGEFVINVTTVELAEHIETVAREYPSGVMPNREHASRKAVVPTVTSICVRTPADLPARCRSMPIQAPRNAAASNRMMTRSSSCDSGKPNDSSCQRMSILEMPRSAARLVYNAFVSNTQRNFAR